MLPGKEVPTFMQLSIFLTKFIGQRSQEALPLVCWSFSILLNDLHFFAMLPNRVLKASNSFDRITLRCVLRAKSVVRSLDTDSRNSLELFLRDKTRKPHVGFFKSFQSTSLERSANN